MARIVLSTLGSLGDLHPMIALARELQARGHDPVINSWEGYRERVRALNLGFSPLRPDLDVNDGEIHRRAMDSVNGPEFVIKDLAVGNIRDTHADLVLAVRDADLLVTGEIVYPAAAVTELTGIRWVSTSLSPIALFSAEDPGIFFNSEIFELLRMMPAFISRGILSLARLRTRSWLDGYRGYRRELGLTAGHDPIFRDKFSPLMHLVLFSRALAEPQADWPSPMRQCGFCFFDESGVTELDPRLAEFLDAGPPPIVFTLGSAASYDPGEFFDDSAAAARSLGLRAVLLYGRDQKVPAGLTDGIAAFEFAPYSLIFPRAAIAVHQGGVGTTAQALRAGVPQIIVPFSHDQPDNASRCRRAGVAEIVSRAAYGSESVAPVLARILADPRYSAKAAPLKSIIDSEDGTRTACDVIEDILRNSPFNR